MMTEVTMKTLSQMSGYSVSTVSKALNDKKDISLKTRKLIKALADRCGFVPNTAAIALRSQKSNTVAIVVPQINSRIYGNILNSIEESASKRGYRVIVQQYFNCENGASQCVRNLRNGGIDGLILLGNATQLRRESLTVKQLLPAIVEKVDENLEVHHYKQLGHTMILNLLYKIDCTRDELVMNAI